MWSGFGSRDCWLQCRRREVSPVLLLLAHNYSWRWSLWEMLWLSGPIWVLMFLCLPETSASNILLRRARRLRKLTGNNRLRSQSEIDQSHLTFHEVLVNALYIPVQIAVLDPAVAFTNVYSSLVYGIYYSFFEVFPLVYPLLYGFNLGQLGLAFISITVAVVIAMSIYSAYMYFIVERRIKANGLPPLERWLIPALFSSFLPPIGLFLFGISLLCLANVRLDGETSGTLDCKRHWNYDIYCWRIHYLSMCLYLHTFNVPTICRVSFCW